MKERVTLTLEKGLLERIDRLIDGTRIKSRSHAVEILLQQAIGQKMVRKAFIIAGGKGTRLKPITQEIPKPMLPVQGKPILEHIIELFKKYGITEIVLSIGYKGDKIREYFGDGARFGVKITYVEEISPLGTAGPLRLARHLLSETFFMSNADELKSVDLNDMFRFHKDSGAEATIALTTVRDPKSYGIVRLKGNRIVDFIEKPRSSPSPSGYLINSGLYILEPSVIDLVHSKNPCSIERDVFPKLAKQGKLFGYVFEGQWFDCSTLESYERAIKDWKGV